MKAHLYKGSRTLCGRSPSSPGPGADLCARCIVVKERMGPPILERIIEGRTRTDGDHLLWTGAMANGVPDARWGYSHVYVQRLVWEEHHGTLGAELSVYRLCRRPRCIALDHLLAATLEQWARREDTRRNLREAGRQDGARRRKLSRRDVARLIARRVAGISLAPLIRELDCTPGAAYNAVNGFTYRDGSAPARGDRQ